MNAQYSGEANLLNLSHNPYPGRGIVIGLDETGENLVQVYWIMGRSENSRNRVLSADGGRVFTEAADPAKMKDPSLIIYNAMQSAMELHVVSNGDQTDTAMERMQGGSMLLERALEKRSHEPDSPNFTSRITGCCIAMSKGWEIQLSIIRKSLWSEARHSEFYRYSDMRAGAGYGIFTYAGDGDPLPSYSAKPMLLPMLGDINDIANTYWNILNDENRVALAVKFIPLNGDLPKVTVINKYQKAAPKD